MSGQLGRLVSPQRGVEYLRRLGLTPQVPRPCHVGSDWIEQHKFTKSARPAARGVELTRTQTATPLELWSCDEHRVGLKPILRRIGAPRGCRPIAPGHHRYQWLSLYGFVRPASGEVVWFIANAIDAAMFSALLKAFAQEIRAGPDKQVILVLDGAGSHVAKDLEVPDGIELMFLPPYSPELQPAEHLWPLTDEALANVHFETLDDLDETLAEPGRIRADHPEQISANTLFSWWPASN